MTFELWMLLGAAAWGLVHISVASFAFKAQVGNRYTVGARDEARVPTGMAGRLHRAQVNFLETFPVFVAAVLVIHLAGISGDFSRGGALLYVASRIVYLPLYAMGVPWLRSLAWDIATLGIVLIGLQTVL